MAALFWYLVKSDLSSVRYCTSVYWTSHFLPGTRNTRPYITGQPVPVIFLDEDRFGGEVEPPPFQVNIQHAALDPLA